MKRQRIGSILAVVLLGAGVIGTLGLRYLRSEAQVPDEGVASPSNPMDPAQQGQQQQWEYETDPDVIRAVLSGGVPMVRWNEGLMFQGIEPMPWLVSAANWFPNTEELQPDELRITFMGTTPTIRPGQMNTSVYVELGNGDSFTFDLGEGSIANYLASGVPLNQINDIFITHLHVDHFGSLPYAYVFGAWGGRWHEPFRVYGPSGRSEEAFNVFPIGQGWDIELTEFDFKTTVAPSMTRTASRLSTGGSRTPRTEPRHTG